VVIDGVGESTFDRSFDALAVRGHLISYGQASGDIGDRNISRFAAKSARLSRPNFGHYADEPHKVGAMTNNLFDAIRRGLIQVRVGQRFPLADVAHRALESRQTVGSTLLIP
jgi:NADPH:quinone reductase-like Zn-dependent oxidoreductase